MKQPIKLQEYTISDAHIEASIRLLLIADLHSSEFGKDQKELLDLVRETAPDVILFSGDFFDDKLPHQNSKLVLAALGNSYPCFYVSGNHEYRRGEAEQLKEIVRSFGVTVLEGQTKILERNGQQISIGGVDDPWVGEDVFAAQLEACAAQKAKAAYNILLTHHPERIDSYLDHGFDLILAGHAHGGQWRIPGLINGLFAPHQGLFPKYAGGQYDFAKTTMIVSRGLAKDATIVPRIANPLELVIIDLVSA